MEPVAATQQPDAAGGNALRVSGARQLFVDDFLIDGTSDLQRTLHQPTKFVGNPVVMPLSPCEGQTANCYGTVLYDQGMFRMWYQGFGGTPYSAHYATSQDGIYWEKPSLGLVEHNGDKDNNLFLYDMATPTLIKDPRDGDPERLYKALFYEVLQPNTSVAFSPDGIHWTKYEGNPVARQATDLHNLLGWDEEAGKYVAYIRPDVRQTGRIRTVGRSVSDDFIHWTTPEVVLAPDETDPPGTEFYWCPVFKYQGTYFGLPSVYHTYLEEPQIRMGAPIDVQLITSRDGVHWERTAERGPFIARGGPGAIDSGEIYCAKEPLIVGDELWFYYGGFIVDHGTTHDERGRPAHRLEDGSVAHGFGEETRQLLAQRGGTISLAKLRLDGFVSMDATQEEGYLVTKPFLCEGGDLLINAQARGGCITVAVLDEAGHHIGDYYSGYKKIECSPFDSDSLHHKVTWRHFTSLSSLEGRVIRLKFYLRNARLYSFELTGDEEGR